MKLPGKCEYLEWDSKFFGKRIARTLISRLNEQLAGEIECWCMAEQIDCLYFLADCLDPTTALVAQERDFRFVDVRLTLASPVSPAQWARDETGFTVRNSLETDIPALKLIARNVHRNSRFYFDGRFRPEQCDELYESWIERSVRGWADQVLIADSGGEAEGYLTCHLRRPGIAEIGLVGVAERARGRGVGRSLVTRGLEWFARNGVKEVSVVTQGRNISAQRLYQRCGFSTQSVGIWFHRWFSSDRQGK